MTERKEKEAMVRKSVVTQYGQVAKVAGTSQLAEILNFSQQPRNYRPPGWKLVEVRSFLPGLLAGTVEDNMM